MTSTYRKDATGALPSRQKRNGRRLIAQMLAAVGCSSRRCCLSPIPERSHGRRTCDVDPTASVRLATQD